MKKVIFSLVGLVVFILGSQASLANTSSGSGYNAPVVRSAFNFTAVVQAEGSVKMSWVPYAPTGFNYYKVVRSTTNSNPVYPDDGYILASGDSNLSSYVDQDPPIGKVYYRVCSIASPNRYCSAVVALVIGSDSTVVSEPTSSVLTPATLILKGLAQEGYAMLSWSVEGSTPYGFKICKSAVNEKPTYPVIPGDAYQYLTDPNIRQLKDSTVKAGLTYHYRVCQYDGKGACVSYSNAVPVAMTTDGANAEADKTTVSEPKEGGVLEPAALELFGGAGDGYLKLAWTIEGVAPYGFKIVKSATHEKPTYPVMEGDDYVYLDNASVRSFKDTGVKAGTTYHYRVCQYDGSGCVSYSNPLALVASGTATNAEKPLAENVGVVLRDVEGHVYETAIDYMVNKNIVQGYADDTFRPDMPVNRAEFLKMLLLAKVGVGGIGEGARCFRDVTTGWYAPYVCYAKQNGVVSGYPDGTFKPSRTISFAEAAKMVSELFGIETQAGPNWYAGYVVALQNKHYIPPTVTMPDKPLSRGEVAELVWRVKEQRTDQPSAEVPVSEGAESISMASGEYAGWQTFEKNGYSFYYPAGWYRGLKSYGWDIVSEEKDYIDNLNTPNYMAVDSYVATYVAVKSGANESSLAAKMWFAHPLVSSKNLTINGYSALRRHFRAPRGTVVNGRTTGENENIVVYTYLKDGKVIVLQYFNAFGTELYGAEVFEKIAKSFK